MADAIINSGPREAGANPIQTSEGDEAREKKQAEQEEMGDGGSTLLIYSRRRPTGDPYDQR